MALFGRKKNTEEKRSPSDIDRVVETGGEQKKAAGASSSAISNHAHVFVSPRITEKATMHEASGVYTFDVAPGANKREIIAAISKIYKLTPRKVRIVQIPEKRKRSMRTGKRGVKRGGKKAYVYLKKGETINVR
ncbi:MAG: 50S ribosomal protein L23 [Parcubacteria group bacterium GW2011_GWA2_51_10]|nr:MAG: 50S ribosomal protein L23 [Parcubacteria group bacterium GW2011_GWA2_51_10]